MAKRTKEEKARDQLAALLDLQDAIPTQDSHDRSMEAEAVLEYYENPRTFTHKNCKRCDRSFATRGAPVAYCSDLCRKRTFEERLGINWRPLRSVEERWGFLGEPLTVPPEALAVVQAVMPQDTDTKPDSPSPVSGILDILTRLGIA